MKRRIISLCRLEPIDASSCRAYPTRRSNPTAIIEGCPANRVTSASGLVRSYASCVCNETGRKPTLLFISAWIVAFCQTWSVGSGNRAYELWKSLHRVSR
jgi:hypothetical protein